jgi:GxxExxY protein
MKRDEVKGCTGHDLRVPENRISEVIVDASIEVHRTLGGPGLLEGVYEEALSFELSERGLKAQRQLPIPINHKGHRIGPNLRLDLLVEGIVIVECKAVSEYNLIFDAQALTYLRLLNLRLALVINFGARTVVEGLHRVVNGL